jgi:hypothetical protein
MRTYLTVLGLLFALSLSAPAQSQMVIDASKITCDQFVHGKVDSPRIVAAWLSGFYHGQKGATILDLQAFEKNLDQLQAFCYDEKNFNLLVMDAIEKATGAPRQK